MSFQKFLFAAIIAFAGTFGSVASHATAQCSSADAPMVIAYPTGNLTLVYQTCQDGANNYLAGTVTYNNVSFDGQFTINGSVDIQLNMAGSSFGSIVINGGPLLFLINGQTYNVTVNGLTFAFNSAFQPVSSGGSVVINGTATQVTPELWSYLFQ